MLIFVKKFFYTINILVITYIFFLVLFSISSTVIIYKNLVKTSYSIEKEYSLILDKYKKIIIFVLNNNLPDDINYFNSVSAVTYDLLPVKAVNTSALKDIIQNNTNKTFNNNGINNITECYGGRCTRVFISKEEILNKILQDKFWNYGKISDIPIKKSYLFRTSINSFLNTYIKYFITTLIGCFIWYFFQALFFFIKNIKLTKRYTSLLQMSNKNEQELTKQCAANRKLYDGVLFSQELISEYFVHYAQKLLTKEICAKKVDLIEIVLRIERFFNHLVAKRNLNIVLDCVDSMRIIESDDELVFIVLLNLIFKAIHRSKISSEITIRASKTKNVMNIEITDIGYEYKSKLSNKIQIYELPEPILKKLYQKIKTEVSEVRNEEVNIISINIFTFSKVDKRKDENAVQFKII